MKSPVDHLYQIGHKDRRLIIGLMSGTSVDGLDLALCEFSGHGLDTSIELKEFTTIPYNDHFKKEIASVFANRNADMEKVCLLNAWVAEQHAIIINGCLANWKLSNNDIDLVASHGQTIYHAPAALHGLPGFGNATLQIGDGDHLAVRTGIITVSDFRQKHIAGGGEGAPLAAYGDFLVFSRKNENRIMLNIGGIANFTYLPGNLNSDEVFCTDTGPGNTMMDACIREYFPGQYFDEDAQVARSGMINEALLKGLKDHPFFQQGFPKTTGPELFNLSYLRRAQDVTGTTSIAVADVLATLNRFSADTIVYAIQQVVKDINAFRFFVSGGGMHNPLLMEHLSIQLPGANFKTTSALHIHPDAKEAVLFAVLANETICGSRVNFGTGRNGIPSVSLGKISFPC